MSVDGFIAGPNGEMDWVVWDWDKGLNRYVDELTNSVDCIVLGRKLAEGFIPHWANAAANPDHPEYMAGRKFSDTHKVVFSQTLAESVWNNTELAKGDLAAEITNIKKRNGKDIIAYGGATFVSALIKEGLIDEFNIFINPVILGKGMPIFENVAGKQVLTPVESGSFECGIVVLKYAKATGAFKGDGH